MLGSCEIVAFAATTDADRARQFYEGTLGLRLVEDSPFALVFDANGASLRVAKVEALTPQPFTILGWRVPDVRSTVDGLAATGVAFERFDGMDQDERGIWVPPGGERGVAWFKDPDGNLLSVSG
jgi:catechol 2,3-dioxygenase-like lactoylglutathione lyase family enzyme